MKVFFPDSELGMQHVGYNHAVSLICKVLKENGIMTSNPSKAGVMLYCNLPFYSKPRNLKKFKLPILMYTMYEADTLPSLWVKFLNKYIYAAIVPSLWSKECFIKSGVKIPVVVLPLYIDSDEYGIVRKKNMLDKYVFLWQGVAYDPGGRKGVDLVVKAFRELKEANKMPDSMLFLKYNPDKERNRNLKIKGIGTAGGIVHYQEIMGTKQMQNMYSCVDCCVNPTHGEGFGFIPLEQMMRGKPVMITDWSMPFVKPDITLPLDYNLKDSPVTWNHKNLHITRNTIYYNFFGLGRHINLLPKKFNLKEDGWRVKSIGFKGIGRRKLTKRELISNNFLNVLILIQHKTNFYRMNDKRKPYRVFQEYQGRDAHVKIESIKEKMLWCYYNRDAATVMGIKAHHYVEKTFSKKRFTNNINDLLRRIENGTDVFSRR